MEKSPTRHVVQEWSRTRLPGKTGSKKWWPKKYWRAPIIETPQIVDAPAQLIVTIHITTPRSEIQNVMGPGIGEAMAAVTSQSDR